MGKNRIIGIIGLFFFVLFFYVNSSNAIVIISNNDTDDTQTEWKIHLDVGNTVDKLSLGAGTYEVRLLEFDGCQKTVLTTFLSDNIVKNTNQKSSSNNASVKINEKSLLTDAPIYSFTLNLPGYIGFSIDDACDVQLKVSLVVETDGNTPEEIVDAACPCEDDWKNHGDYVHCVTQKVNTLFSDGLITKEDKKAIINQRARKDCGKK